MLVEFESLDSNNATLLNCWKFLRAYLYQVIWSNSDDGLRQEREVRLELNKMLQWITSSQVLIWSGCRSQTKIAVGNSFENYLRYSRADYLRKLIRHWNKANADLSPFRRWTCGRIINTYPRINQLCTCFQLSLLGTWIEENLVMLRSLSGLSYLL